MPPEIAEDGSPIIKVGPFKVHKGLWDQGDPFTLINLWNNALSSIEISEIILKRDQLVHREIETRKKKIAASEEVLAIIREKFPQIDSLVEQYQQQLEAGRAINNQGQ